MEYRHFKKFKTFEEREEYLSCQNIDNVNRDFVGLLKDVDDSDTPFKHLDYIKEDEQMAVHGTTGAHIIDYTEEYTTPARYSLGWEESYECPSLNLNTPCPNSYAKMFTTKDVKLKLTNLDKDQWVIYERDFPIGSPHTLDPDRFDGYPSETNMGEETMSILSNTSFIMTQGSRRKTVNGGIGGGGIQLKLVRYLKVDLFFFGEDMIETHPWKDDTNFKLEAFVQPFTCKEYVPPTPEIEETGETEELGEIGELNETT